MAEGRAIIMQLDDLHEERRLARLAEEAGFDLVWCPDTPRSDTFVHLAALATATSRIRIGSGIARAFVRGPLQTAAAAVDLDRLSGGRMVLGLASGTPRQNLYETGQRFDRAASRIRELVRLLRQVWSLNGEADLDFAGQFYTVAARGNLLPKPLRRDLPIYVAGVGAPMLRVTGEVADGLAGHPVCSVRYVEAVVLPSLAEGLAKAGRRREDFTVTLWVITSIADDRARARREAAYQIGFYLATRAYAHVLDFHGWAEEKAAIQRAFFETRDMEAVADAVSDRMIDELAVAGTAAECREQLRRYRGVIDFPTLYPPGVGPGRLVPQARVRDNVEAIIRAFARESTRVDPASRREERS
jgi:probable F420-dependent oxidoreductase